MIKISGKQCRQARSLLKWNLHDLAGHVKSILARRIDNFEHGHVHLLPWENEEIVSALKKAGIVFKSDFEVALARESDMEQEVANNGMQLPTERIVLDAAQVLLQEGQAGKAASDEEDRRDVKKPDA